MNLIRTILVLAIVLCATQAFNVKREWEEKRADDAVEWKKRADDAVEEEKRGYGQLPFGFINNN